MGLGLISDMLSLTRGCLDAECWDVLNLSEPCGLRVWGSGFIPDATGGDFWSRLQL